MISGTPTTVTAASSYTITASNSDGSGSATISIEVAYFAWQFEAYLKAPNSGANDYFGYDKVAVDGDTIVVGAYGESSDTTAIISGDDLSATNDDGDSNGAVYVFKRSGSTWTHEAYLKAPNSEEGDEFGGSVAIDGDTIAVGAGWEDSTTTEIINGDDLSTTNSDGDRNGAVYVFKRSGSTWTHEAYLKSPNNDDIDFFGGSVAIDGDTIAVGADYEDSSTRTIINGDDLSATNDDGDRNGAVYVFKRSGSTWTHEAYLKAPNSRTVNDFGGSVAIDGDTIVVGADLEDSTTKTIINGDDLSATNSNGEWNGAAYVFKRSGSTWTHEAYLKAPNSGQRDYFGGSVAIDGDTIAVGASAEDSSTTAIINGDDLSATNDDGDNNGAVYVFKRSGSTWTHEAYLKAPNSGTSDRFSGVAIAGDTIVVGAYGESSDTTAIIYGSDLSTTNDDASHSGAVYVFKRSGSTWTHEAYLKAPNNGYGDEFGDNVAIDGDTIVVGAYGESSDTTAIINDSDLSTTNDDASYSGAVYVFRYAAK